MKIVHDYPPIIDRIREKFAITETTVFTWGDTVFVPSGNRLGDDVEAHEMIHEQQQAGDPITWWDKYLEDPEFRFNQELAAYRAQWKYFSKGKGREQTFRFLNRIASDLSGKIYGNCVDFDKAKKLIKQV